MRFVLLVIVLAIASPLPGADFPAQEYRSAAQKYVSSLYGLEFEYSESDKSLDDDVRFLTDYTFISDQNNILIKSVETTTGTPEPLKPKTTWHLLRPDGYGIIQETESNKYILISWDPAIKSIFDISNFRSTALGPLLMPISYRGYNMLDVIDNSRIRISHFEFRLAQYTAPSADTRSLTIAEQRIDRKSQAKSVCQFNSDFLLTNHNFSRIKDPTRRDYRIEYTSFNGRVVPVSCQIDSTTNKGLTPAGFQAEFTNYRKSSARASDFAFARFGLPEPPGSTFARPTPVYVWLLLGAVACAIIAALARWRLRRAAQTTATA